MEASWEGDDDALSRVQKGLAGRGWTQQRFQNHVQQMRCRQSQDRPHLGYLKPFLAANSWETVVPRLG